MLAFNSYFSFLRHAYRCSNGVANSDPYEVSILGYPTQLFLGPSCNTKVANKGSPIATWTIFVISLFIFRYLNCTIYKLVVFH